MPCNLSGKLNGVVAMSSPTRSNSVEMFLCGGDTHVNPVSHWDGAQIGDGTLGAITREIYEMILEEEVRSIPARARCP